MTTNCLERVKAAKLVRVCVWPDYYGITYRNPKTQQLSGMDIDLTNADWARLVSPSSTCHVAPYAYAMKRGDNVRHARLDNFVSDIKRDGRLMAAAKRHSLNPIVAP